VNDGEKISDPYNFLITVRAVNDAPVITIVDSAALRIQNSEPIQLIGDIQISDPDNDSLTLVEIAFTPETYSSESDKLMFTNTGLVKGVFDSQNGILALIGKAPINEYVLAIKSIQYQSTGSSARTNATVNISASDGRAVSNKVSKLIVFGNSTVVGSLDIPTGFTPNGDMVNDTWSIRPIDNSQNFNQAVLRVYTKAGILVFESTGLESEWDGRLNGQILPADVYFYTVDFKLATPEANIKGIVTILR
jgi:gliding motility-associated-like protein